ncbi:hypothetical protein T08_7621 [Trichinella sp. T8]|nr:hypothetical protein T08_7621 [Trichinella sp. T8]
MSDTLSWNPMCKHCVFPVVIATDLERAKIIAKPSWSGKITVLFLQSPEAVAEWHRSENRQGKPSHR